MMSLTSSCSSNNPHIVAAAPPSPPWMVSKDNDIFYASAFETVDSALKHKEQLDSRMKGMFSNDNNDTATVAFHHQQEAQCYDGDKATVIPSDEGDLGALLPLLPPSSLKSLWKAVTTDPKVHDIPRGKLVFPIKPSKIHKGKAFVLTLKSTIANVTETERTTLRNLCSHIGTHPMISNLRSGRNCDLIFDVWSHTLFDIFNNITTSLSQVLQKIEKELLYQALKGLAFLHGAGYYHGNITPKTLFVDLRRSCLKVGDLSNVGKLPSNSLKRQMIARKTDIFPMSKYELNYSAPEILLELPAYDPCAADIWSVGCIAYELQFKQPIFIDMSREYPLFEYCKRLGTPTKEECTEVWGKSNAYPLPFITYPKPSWLTPNSLLSSLLAFAPFDRPTCIDTCLHDIFDPLHDKRNFQDRPGTFAKYNSFYHEEWQLLSSNLMNKLQDRSIYNPRCKVDKQIMLLSKISPVTPAKAIMGWICKVCRNFIHSSFHPVPYDALYSNVYCPVVGTPPVKHKLDVCTGAIHNARDCNVCGKKNIHSDPHYLHCPIQEHDFDLCMTCANKRDGAVFN